MKLIGFSGGMGSGKSTAIYHLQGLYPNTAVVLVKFAGPLYEMQEAIYKIVLPVHVRPESFTKDRKLLQWLGTDWGRDTIGENVWVDLWKAKVQEYNDFYRTRHKSYIIVCDDVRFDNEAAVIKKTGGKVVKLISPTAAERAEGGTGIVAHKSEAGISKELVDYEINNTGTLAEYKTALSSLYKGFLHI